MANLRSFLLAGLLGGLLASSLFAQTSAPASDRAPTQEEIDAHRKKILEEVERLGWTREGVGKLGALAEVSIPKGYRFTDGNGTRGFKKLTDNYPNDRELGMLTTEGAGPWIVFEWDDSGYVSDAEKNQLDADAMLESLQQGQESANKRRKEAGMGQLHLIGWAVPPRFNDTTKNLEWAVRAKDEDGIVSVNYNTRLLGRGGVMAVTLVCEPEEMQGLMGQYQATIASFHYVAGQTYAEYRPGDKVAKYGLTALVAGGAAVAASKAGLFAKLGIIFAKMGKAAVLLVVGVAAAIKKMLSKLFGRSVSE